MIAVEFGNAVHGILPWYLPINIGWVAMARDKEVRSTKIIVRYNAYLGELTWLQYFVYLHISTSYIKFCNHGNSKFTSGN